MTITLPETMPFHWDSRDGHSMAIEYVTLTRSNLGKSALSDFALANAVFLVDRYDLRLIEYQSAAKERIRWLSVQLASANVVNDALVKALEGLLDAFDCFANEVNWGASALSGSTISKVNEVPGAALAILTKAKGGAA